jgi:dienelactone hydrolase
MRCTAILVVSLALVLASQANAGGLTVLQDSPDGIKPGQQLEVYLKQGFYAQVERRLEAFEEIKSRADARKWQRERVDFFLRQMGGLPERTPLNARTVGKLEGKGYRVEKVMFESRPRHHVTGTLYLPLTKAPYPAVLVPCGHSHNGKASGHYQRISILLAKNGIAALCYDPVGQGERYQMIDYKNDHEQFKALRYKLVPPHPRVQYVCTIEHTTMGLGCTLLGSNIAQFRIWDGMRAIDYLQSREDIIADKIGCTGISGGGTMTSYLMALDERIVAAAPGCFPMTYRRLIDTKGAQDGEQAIFGQIAFGMDQADYFMMRAPRPSLILGATRDATFDIEGTWPLFREAKRFYTRLGYPERMDMIEADVPHGFYYPLREASAQWMRRWLLGIDDVVREFEDLPDPLDDKQMRALNEGDWTDQELRCTPEGLTLLMDGERSVFEINAEQEKELREKREAVWNELKVLERRGLIRKTIGLETERKNTIMRSAGGIDRSGYRIEKMVVTSEPGIDLPVLAFIPPNPKKGAVLYLHGTSMAADAEPGGEIEKLMKEGDRLVFAAELRGIGETETGHDKRDYGGGQFGRDVQEIFLAYLMGRSYVGMRTGDVAALTRFLGNYLEMNNHPEKIHLVAQGEAAIPALHAAALYPDRFESVRLTEMIVSWAEIVSTPENLNQAVSVVHGALKHYDLPDLIEMAGKDRVTIERRVDVMGQPWATAKLKE